MNLDSLSEKLNQEFKQDNSIWLSNGYTLRKTIGVLGMGLPLFLYIFLYIDTGFTEPLESISHYYYTRVSGFFVAILSILAIFLMIYKGKSPIDLIVSLIAGIAALLVVFFPTDNITDICCNSSFPYSVTILEKSDLRETVHYIAAAFFLGCLAYMSIFLFTKSNKSINERGLQKLKRDRIYRICGIIMILAIAIIFFGGFLELIPKDVYVNNKLTFWMETVAIESFGFSWLVKGDTLFKDK